MRATRLDTASEAPLERAVLRASTRAVIRSAGLRQLLHGISMSLIRSLESPVSPLAAPARSHSVPAQHAVLRRRETYWGRLLTFAARAPRAQQSREPR